ncbi:MAG: hypothetical protein F4Z96_02195 [Chloroflexi bacterium]|nr:hypothetical protein [Chloroflexota bacterium]
MHWTIPYDSADSTLYDRLTGRAFMWGSDTIELDEWWGSGSTERLLFQVVDSGEFVSVNGELDPVARMSIPPGERFIGPDGRYILVRECSGCEPGDRFHLLSPEVSSGAPTATWTLPWQADPHLGPGSYRLDLLERGIMAITGAEDGSCRVAHFDLRGALVTDLSVKCFGAEERWYPAFDYPDASPDGRLLAVPTAGVIDPLPYSSAEVWTISIIEIATGDELLRVKGAAAPWPDLLGRADVWLADSSGIVVGTTLGERIVLVDGQWLPTPGTPSLVHPDLFVSTAGLTAYGDPVEGEHPRIYVRDQQGVVRASLAFGSSSNPLLDFTPAADYTGPRWGQNRNVLVYTTAGVLYESVEVILPPLPPVIERPPFDDRLLVEGVDDRCVDLHREPSLEAVAATCLPKGALALADDFFHTWLHVRTGYNIEGWARTDHLRWHSDGVRLEE